MYSFIVAALLVFKAILTWQRYTTCHRHKKLPPGPIPLPIVGNLHLLGKFPYRALHKQSQKYGPIMSISLGSVQAVVVSSPEAAKLFLKTHDAIFASRPIFQISKYISYGSKGIALAEYGRYWWEVRKFCAVELLSDSKINDYAHMRREELELIVEKIRTASEKLEVINLSETVGGLIENMICIMLFGRKNDQRFVFRGLVDEIMMAGAINLGDYMPMLASFDLQISLIFSTKIEKSAC
ncbi:hypothetical protein L2E82_10073 [Cichorium intybus]|uniref:Uncharacterized protein n=1 Tax=Cichorium intybus TaxID=13427 RepID=A0ACB9G9Q1_CICIN|nr:hypothetical protein L2E82_10073 [Cichorium intybus]